MKRARGRALYVCKGQVDIWHAMADLARYKRDAVPTEKVIELLGFLLARYGTWAEVADVTGIKPHLLRSWHEGKVVAIDRDHAIHIVQVVLAHRKPKDALASDRDVERRLPSTREAEIAHREEQRAWRAYYRARARGEDVKPPGDKDTSRTRGRKPGAA